MKKIILFLSILFAVTAQAQTVVCTDSIVDKSYYKDSVTCSTITTPKTCYNASIKITPVLAEKKDTIYTTKCNIWCWFGFTDPVKTIYKINTSYYQTYDTVIVQTPYDCSIKTTICDTFKVLVPQFDTFVNCVVTYPETKWGAKLQGKVPEQIEAAKKLGITHIRPNSIELKSYNGDISGIKQWYDAGFKIVLNVNWSSANPAPFAKGKDLETFKEKFEQLVNDAGSMVEMYVIENEETNTTFYDYVNYTVDDYLAELQAAVDICEKSGKQITDGGLHIKIIEQIMLGNLKKDNVIRQNRCIEYFSYLNYDKFFINTHIEFADNQYSADLILNAIEYLRAQTGHDVVSNEWHTEKCTPSFVQKAVNEWVKAKIKYCMIWGGNYIAGEKFTGGSEADAVNKGKELTDMGGDYSTAIKQ